MARPKLGDSETERLHMKITAEELAAIDDWRYENRVPSRSEAVRRLVQVALRFHHQINEIIKPLDEAAQTIDTMRVRWDDILEEVGDDDDLSYYAKLVTIMLADHFDSLQDNTFNSYNKLADLVTEIVPILEAPTIAEGLQGAREARKQINDRLNAELEPERADTDHPTKDEGKQ